MILILGPWHCFKIYLEKLFSNYFDMFWLPIMAFLIQQVFVYLTFRNLCEKT